ncbi:bile acid:sodium symporter family protein [Actinomadura sp. GC306]|uniref:bile acid:sodium symporter family protein n=1 Tax=Actinomadura sp. GC306 TaxID=2530367 RepID=UPI001048A3D3|nr:bile acid:sodium symporter family protein [Actinomadura sp. GC306]TDC71812.1 bile acid:sodium symporter family protein [Actinomadura sp. GC306]
MNDSALITVGLPVALAIIMFGLGLSLTPGDFRRVARSPKAVIVALVLQMFVLPLVAFGLVVAFDVDPLVAVGVMLLAASPGGTTANLFSHLFRGDVALNVTLTAINSVLAAVSIPLITNLAIGFFDAEGTLGLQFGKVVQVVGIVLVPVGVGMLVRGRSDSFAAAADRPVRIFSIVVLVAVSLGAILGERENIVDYVRDVGIVVTLFCLASLTFGYTGARLFRLGREQAIATSMEVGIHNTTVALTIALSVLNSTAVAIPAAVYSIVMYVLATAFGFSITRTGTSGREETKAHA